MRLLLFLFIWLVSIAIFSQEVEIAEEFIPINLEDKEAFISTKTGEYVFLKHDKTDASKLKTTSSGVIYTDIQIHTVTETEKIDAIAKRYDVSVTAIIEQNKLSNTKLHAGQELQIIKTLAVKSSSPVISQGESRIVAKLQPGQSPSGLDAAAPSAASTPNNPLISANKPVIAENTTVATKKAQANTTDNLNSFYIVKKGDTLYSIAKSNNITVARLKEINNLTSNNLDIGQKLLLK